MCALEQLNVYYYINVEMPCFANSKFIFLNLLPGVKTLKINKVKSIDIGFFVIYYKVK